MKKYLVALGAVVLIVAGCAGEPQDGQYAELAQCLTDKGVKFYGAFWCPHCQSQKKMFGDDIRYIDYVECDPAGDNADPDACREAGVSRYPTWSFPGQGNITGEQSPEDLAKKANCDAFITGEDSETAESPEATETEEPTEETESAEATESTETSEETSEESSEETSETTEETESPAEEVMEEGEEGSNEEEA